MSMPPNPHKMPMTSHFLIGSPRIAFPKNGAIKVFVKKRQKALENDVFSNATKRRTSLSTPNMHLRSRSFWASFGTLKISTRYCLAKR